MPLPVAPSTLTLHERGMAVLPIFEEMQAKGMPADRHHFERLAEEMDDEMAAIQSRISHRYYGDRPFNPNSPIDVRALLRRRGLSTSKRTKKTRLPSTSKPSIEHLRYVDPAIGDVFDWRERAHIRDSFCAPVLERIPPEVRFMDVRCQLRVTKTATRRLAASDPNLLNIPARTELGMRVREGYRCEDGYTFGAWDLSQIEVRVAAHESGDPFLCSLIRDGADIHTATAAAMWGIAADEVTKEQRTAAKSTTFGILYGIGAHGLMLQLQSLGLADWTEERCEETIRRWYEVYEGVAEYRDRVIAEVRRTGVVRDCWGMPRPLPAIWSNRTSERAEAERIAVNHRIQGGAQGWIQESMRWLKDPVWRLRGDEGVDIWWRLQLHDELILTMPDEEGLWDWVDGLMVEGLTEHGGMELRVPVEAGSARAVSWGGLK